MKRHVEIGANILSLVDFPYPVVPIVRCHHENWDGSGYPAGVSGTDIPIGARILSVVDCFDALTSDRPYRRAMTDEAAIAILLDRRGKMYDPDVVDAFIRIHADVRIAEHDEPGRVEVLQQINRSLQGQPTPEPQSPRRRVPASARRTKCWRSSAWRVSREGNGSTADVLALVDQPDPEHRARRVRGVVHGQRQRRASDRGGSVRPCRRQRCASCRWASATTSPAGSPRTVRRSSIRMRRSTWARARRIDAAARQLPERAADRRPDARGRADDVRARPRGVHAKTSAGSSRWWRRTSRRRSMRRVEARGRISCRPRRPAT